MPLQVPSRLVLADGTCEPICFIEPIRVASDGHQFWLPSNSASQGGHYAGPSEYSGPDISVTSDAPRHSPWPGELVLNSWAIIIPVRAGRGGGHNRYSTSRRARAEPLRKTKRFEPILLRSGMSFYLRAKSRERAKPRPLVLKVENVIFYVTQKNT